MSLVTTPTSELDSCSRCGGTRVTGISMTLTDGSSVDFASCHTCEHKSWTQGGRSIDFGTVLVMATKNRT